MRALGRSTPDVRWVLTALPAAVVLLGIAVLAAAQTPSRSSGADAPVPGHGAGATQSTDEGLIHRARPSAASATRAAVSRVPAAGDTEYFLQVALALGLIIALIFLLRWLGRRFFSLPGDARSSKAVQVLSRSVIAPRQQVMLLRVGRRVVVVAHCGAQMNTLCQITAPEEVADLLAQVRAGQTPPISKAFGSLFGRAEDKFSQPPAQDPASPSGDGAAAVDPAMGTTRQELDGLMDKVRGMSQRFRPSPPDAD